MEIPASVKKAAYSYVKDYGDHVRYLGEYEGTPAYFFVFPKDLDVGFPVVWLDQGSWAKQVDGREALLILAFFNVE